MNNETYTVKFLKASGRKKLYKTINVSKLQVFLILKDVCKETEDMAKMYLQWIIDGNAYESKIALIVRA